MSLRRYRRRGGGCIVRTVNEGGGDINDVGIGMSWSSTVGEKGVFGFFFNPVGKESEELNSIEVMRTHKPAYGAGMVYNVISSHNSTELNSYLAYHGSLISQATYTLFWWHVKDQTDDEIIYASALTFQYPGTIEALKDLIRPYEELAAEKCDVVNDETNVCFCIVQVPDFYYCNCSCDWFQVKVTATLNGQSKTRTYNNNVHSIILGDKYMDVFGDSPVYSGSINARYLIGWDPEGIEYSFQGFKIGTGDTTYLNSMQPSVWFEILPTNGYA